MDPMQVSGVPYLKEGIIKDRIGGFPENHYEIDANTHNIGIMLKHLAEQ